MYILCVCVRVYAYIQAYLALLHFVDIFASRRFHGNPVMIKFVSNIFFLFYFIFRLYITVLVLPNIKMNLPQVYMCSPSWTLLPPPSPFHPSGSHFMSLCHILVILAIFQTVSLLLYLLWSVIFHVTVLYHEPCSHKRGNEIDKCCECSDYTTDQCPPISLPLLGPP